MLHVGSWVIDLEKDEHVKSIARNHDKQMYVRIEPLKAVTWWNVLVPRSISLYYSTLELCHIWFKDLVHYLGALEAA